MDGIEDLSNVIVIGATNRPDMLDSALLRPGRFDRILLVSAPDKKGREQVFRINTKNMPLAKDVNIEKILEQTEGYVGADMESLVRESAMLALRENIENKEVKMKHFDAALKKVSASVTKSDIDKYRRIETDYLRSAKAALENSPVAYLG
jgi:transitional endoplasmic reticulum ATPase